MAWWNVWFGRGKREQDYEGEALQSGWVAPIELPVAPIAQVEVTAGVEDAALFLDRVYTNQAC